MTRLSPLPAAGLAPGDLAASAGGNGHAGPASPASEKPGAEQVQRQRESEREGPWVVASHEVLFRPDDVVRCDVCGKPVEDEASSDEGYALPGSGAYLWARGDEVRVESAPLCASCASAIGMTALGRWEIEEEEG